MTARLPVQRSITIGRKQSLATVRKLLQRPDTRVVTVTGPGGVGKTRLALELATQLEQASSYRDGVVFVPLAEIRDPALVIPTVAGLVTAGDAATGSPVTALAAYLRERQMLLVLDNLEQVVDAAIDLSELIQQCPELRLLVTSRVPLHLHDECEFPLQPLDLPDRRHAHDLDELLETESVALFVERARRVRPEFALTAQNAGAIVEVCHLLDGLPLAIELAAARVKLLTPQAMVGHLEQRLALLTGGPRDLPARQRTMRDTVAWSYGLLGQDARRLFRLASVFVGGWTMEMAADVADGGLDMLDVHSQLIDHSLIRQVELPDGSVRFTMLETIRSFGLEQLLATGESDAIRHRVSQSIAAMIQSGEPPTYWARVTDAWLNQLSREHDNIRAVLDWSVAHDPALALRLGGSLYWFWLTQGHLSEGRRRLAAVLDAAAHASDADRAKALAAAADLACWQMDYQRADELYEESLALFLRLDDFDGVGRTRYGLARTAMFRADFDTAIALYDQCLETYSAIEDIDGLTSTQFNLAVLLRATGDLDRAEELFLACDATARERSGTSTIMVGLSNLCWLELARRRWVRALEYGIETLEMFQAAGEVRIAIESVEGIAIAAGMLGQRERAARLLGAADAHRKRIAYPFPDMDQAEFSMFLAELRIEMTEPVVAAAWSGGQEMSIEEIVADALGLASTLTSVEPVTQHAGLTPRQLDVLRLLVEGMTDREIAADLFISHHTVMRHVSNILGKLGVDSRTAAATHAVRERLV